MIIHDLILATRRAKLTGIERFAINVFDASRSRNSDVVALVAPGSSLAGSAQVVECGSALGGWLGLRRDIQRFGPNPAVVCAAFPASPSLIASRIPIARVIHDAFAWTHPQNLTLQGRMMFMHYDRMMLRNYAQIHAPTDIVRQDLVAALGLKSVSVCGNAPGLDCLAPDMMPVDGVAPGKFTLAVGTIEPRKNYERLIDFARSNEAVDPIIIVGRPGWGGSAEQLATACRDLGNRLMWLDNVNDAQLRWLYRNSKAFLALSHAEGFNMPLVEAGILGCPIVCSDLPIHRAVAPPWAHFLDSKSSNTAFATALGNTSPPPAPALDAYRNRYDWITVAANIERPLREMT